MSSVLSDAAVSSADWLRREEERLFGRYARAARRLPLLFRFRVPLVIGVYVAVAVLAQGLNGPGADAVVFASAGNTLFSAHWAQTFASPVVQSGPLFILLEGVGLRLGSGAGLPSWCGGGLATALVAALLLVAASRGVLAIYKPDSRTAAARELGACMVFALTGGVWVAAMYAHQDDLLVTALLLVGASRAANGRHGQAGVIFGLAAAVKLWAIIAIAVLLIRASRWAALRAALAAAATIAICYGPFVVFGRFEMFRGSWQIEHDAPLNLLFRNDTDFSWQLRLFQAMFAITVGMVVVLRTRGRNCAVWLVPAAAIAARLLADPRNIPYYYTSVLMCVLLGQWASGRLTTFGTTVVTASWMVIAMAIFATTSGVVASWLVVVFCVGVIALAIRYGARDVRSARPKSRDLPVPT